MPKLPPRDNSISNSVSESGESSIGDMLNDTMMSRCSSVRMPRMPTRMPIGTSMSEGMDIGSAHSKESFGFETTNTKGTTQKDDRSANGGGRTTEEALAPLNELGESKCALTSDKDSQDESGGDEETVSMPAEADMEEPNFTQFEGLDQDEKESTLSIRPQMNKSKSFSLEQGESKPELDTNGISHLNVSCVTLDSAFNDERTVDDGTGIGGMSTIAYAHDELMVIEKEMTDATGELGIYSGAVSAKKNRPNGHGIMQYANGKHYTGGWKEGSWHGMGVLTGANGERYEGEFVFAKRHGAGIFGYDNSDVYEGNFTADRPHGQGTFRFHDGGIYSGGFVFGAFEGKGCYEFDGGRYDGRWEAGSYHGQGILQYIDGGCYSGEFRGGKPHGTGEIVLADGTRRKGTWKQGELLEEQEDVL